MDVVKLKSELSALDSRERRRLIAFLLALEEKDNEAYKRELARKIDDKDPSHWVSAEDLERRLGLDGHRD